MGFAKIKGPLTSRVGQSVRFGRPKDVRQRAGEGAFLGRIIDEVWENPAVNGEPSHKQPCDVRECWGDYSFCGQLIAWADGTHSIRLAYYRRRCGEDAWEYASQTTVNSEWEIIKALLAKTLAMTTWFQDNPEPYHASE